MRKLKAAIDPENLINPGKVVPGYAHPSLTKGNFTTETQRHRGNHTLNHKGAETRKRISARNARKQIILVPWCLRDFRFVSVPLCLCG